MIKDIYQLFTRKHIELTIGNLGRLLEINRLLPDDFSHIDFKYYYNRSIEMSDHSFSEIMNIPDLLNLKFIEISNSYLLSPDEFQFLWKMFAARRIYPPITPPVRGVYKPKKMTKFFKLVYPPYPPKTTAINNLIRKYFFNEKLFKYCSFYFYAFVMFTYQYSILNL